MLKRSLQQARTSIFESWLRSLNLTQEQLAALLSDPSQSVLAKTFAKMGLRLVDDEDYALRSMVALNHMGDSLAKQEVADVSDEIVIDLERNLKQLEKQKDVKVITHMER